MNLDNGADGRTGMEAETGKDETPGQETVTSRETGKIPEATPPAPKGSGKKGGGKGGGLKKKRRQERLAARAQEQVEVIDPSMVQPIARPARMKTRHWGLILSFVLMVLLPFAGVVYYLGTHATDQYVSVTGFTVRTQESSAANELLGGLAQFAGGTTASDSDILYEFIQSQEMVEAVNANVDLREHYTQVWPHDWAFGLWPEASMEDLVWYWHRIVGIAYDSGTGLTEVSVSAFDPETAQKITAEIVRESQDRINDLNARAREDALGYARADLEEALERLKGAREALTRFRTRTRIVDPAADMQSRMGVMGNLQQQLAAALIEYDLLRGTTNGSDPRLTKAEQRIEVIRDRIQIERQTFTSDNTDTGAVGEDYPTLIAEYESLAVDAEYAEQSYRAALTALEAARDDAARQSRYLATYIKPTLAQDSEYPQRFILGGLSALFLLLFWSILSLIYYSIRDRS